MGGGAILHSTRKRSLEGRRRVFILCPQSERRFDKDPEGDELPNAGTCDGTLFFQLSYTWYGSVCEASKKCGGVIAALRAADAASQAVGEAS